MLQYLLEDIQKRSIFILYVVFIILSCLLSFCQAQSGNNNNVDQYIVAIQETNQVFTSYLPFIQSCDFNQPGILQGNVTMTELTDQVIFQYTSYVAQVLYFSTLNNGLNLMLYQNNISKGYNGSIYPIQGGNNPNNTIILYNLHKVSGQIQLNYAMINLSLVNGFDETITIQQTLNYTFNKDIKDIIQICLNDGKQVILEAIDPQIFFGFCQNTPIMFFWNITNSTQQSNFSLQVQSVFPDINSVTINPDLYLMNGQSESGWNVMILSQNNQGYLCDFNIFSFTNYSCISFQNFSAAYLVILSRIWSAQTNLQQIRIQRLIDQFGSKFQKQFPGQIVSIYLDQENNVFIQSIQGNLSYVNVFNWKQELLLNISFYGDAITFGSKNMVIQSSIDNQFYVLTFQMPLMLLQPSSLNYSNQYFLNITCQEGVNNIQITYDIFYTNIQFPSFQGFQISNQSNSPFYSQQQIYTYDLDSVYEIFGPAFNVYIRTQTQIAVTLIDSSIVTINPYLDELIELAMIERIGKFVFGGYFASNNSMYYFNPQQDQQECLIISQPCGISSNLNGKSLNQNYGAILYGNDEEGNKIYCHCTQSYTNCEPISQRSSISLVQQSKSSDSVEQIVNLLIQLELYQTIGSQQGSFIKKNIFDLLNQQLLITIYVNNTVTLSNIVNGQLLDSIIVNCLNQNQTEGGVYERSFVDPLIILFCQNTPQITQYIIRNNAFIFNRVIPLYGFVTTNQQNSLLVGNNFLFLQVDLDQQQSYNININRANLNCCVLRLDPFQYTVSVIKEVIFAMNIEFVYKYKGLDIAYYSGSSVTETTTFLQVYFDSTFIALNQTQHTQNIETYYFDVLFSSLIYNFGCIFDSSITYNITSSILSNNNFSLQNIQLSPVNKQQSDQTFYVAQIQFQLNSIIGPIEDMEVFFPNQNVDQIFQVSTNDFFTPDKMIMNLSSIYLQIFTPMQGYSGTTLDNLIFVVSIDYIAIYAKQANNIALLQLQSLIEPPQHDCKYYPNSIINQTTMTFTTSCQNPNFPITPLMTLSYFPNNLGSNQQVESNNNTNSSVLVWSFSQMSILFDLYDMYTILGDVPLDIGVIDGPMKSFTGKLCVCANGQVCQFLYVSSSILFLINYDVQVYEETYVVVTLDTQFIEIFLNIPSPIGNNGTTIQPTYTINLQSFISQDVSVISIVNANSSQLQFVLSGNYTYYQILYSYNTQQPIIRAKFARYVNCQSFDKFQVYLIQERNEILGMIAYCGMNEPTLKLWSFQTIDTSSIIINTGYLQLFSKYGPLSPLNTKQIPYYEPIDIQTISSSMINPLFLIYKVNNNSNQILKILYQQIDGILIDCYLTLKPVITITLQPLTTQFYFPTFGIALSNDYYEINLQVSTSQKIINQLQTLQIVAFGFLIGLNVISVLMILFYFALNHNTILKFDNRNSVGQSQLDQNQTTQGRKTILSKIGINRESRLKTQMINNSPLKRKSTQIQIFTIRSNQNQRNKSQTKSKINFNNFSEGQSSQRSQKNKSHLLLKD